MKAVCIRTGGSLELADVPSPGKGPTEVRLKVRAAGLNRADLLQRRGLYPAPSGVLADVPGLECAGEVLGCGSKVTRWKPGDRVMALLAGGGLAEEVVADEQVLLRIPAGCSFSGAASIPEAFLTAFDALVVQAQVRPQEHVLLHAVGSGVGTAALQLIHQLGARAVGTSRSRSKLERAQRELGLEASVLLGEPGGVPFEKQVVSLTGEGAQVALDLLGGKLLPQTLAAMAPRGRVILIGLLAGAEATVPLARLLAQRLQLVGTVLRTRTLEEKGALVERFAREALPSFDTGALRPVVDREFPMARAVEAFDRLASNETFGKLVLTWN
jgi:NADPH:quinone reductase